VQFIEATDRFPPVGQVVDAATRHDWPALRQAIAGIVRTPDDFAQVSLPVSRIPGVEEWLAPLLEAEPDNNLIAALLIDRLITLAWDKRSGALAKNLTPTQIVGFTETLLRAEQLLLEQLTRHPADPVLWSLRVTSGRGLGVGLAEIRRRYRRMYALAPDFYEGASRFLIALYPKWYGTYDDALAFARERAAGARDGSPLAALPVAYYVEQWRMEPDDDVKALLARPEVHEELMIAAHRSVWSPSHVVTPLTLELHSDLAMLLGIGRWWADAWPHFRVLGMYPPRAGWDLMADPPDAYQKFYLAAQEVAGQ